MCLLCYLNKTYIFLHFLEALQFEEIKVWRFDMIQFMYSLFVMQVQVIFWDAFFLIPFNDRFRGRKVHITTPNFPLGLKVNPQLRNRLSYTLNFVTHSGFNLPSGFDHANGAPRKKNSLSPLPLYLPINRYWTRMRDQGHSLLLLSPSSGARPTPSPDHSPPIITQGVSPDHASTPSQHRQ